MKQFAGVALMAAALTLTTGCNVQTNKHGDKKDVDISTPLGGMSVKTDKNVTPDALGVAAYPGASAVAESKDEKSANVDMHFGDFRLHIVTAKFFTSDPQQKVIDFYRKDLGRYGDVLECNKEHQAVGAIKKTGQGLTCDDHGKHSKVIHIGGKDTDEDLRAGSDRHQHIVSVETQDNGTKFTVVELELPPGSNAD